MTILDILEALLVAGLGFVLVLAVPALLVGGLVMVVLAPFSIIPAAFGWLGAVPDRLRCWRFRRRRRAEISRQERMLRRYGARISLTRTGPDESLAAQEWEIALGKPPGTLSPRRRPGRR